MTRSLQGFLDRGETLERLHDHAARLRRLQGQLERLLPPQLAGVCAVANLKGDTLVLLARNGAAAARLKQTVPSLLEQFAQDGTVLGKIQVRVSLADPVSAQPDRVARTLPESGQKSLESFAESLPPDAPLRESIERLLARSRRGD